MFIDIVAFLFIVLILTFFHEFGHYYVGVKTGMGVDRFFVGFGPTVKSWKRGNTEYGIKAIPLGGYVAFTEVDGKDAFETGPVWRKAAVAFAGPAFNFITAIVLFIMIGMIGIKVAPPVIGSIDSHSIAYQAGLRAGDRIISIDGDPVTGWNYMSIMFAKHAGETVVVSIKNKEGWLKNKSLFVPLPKDKDPLLERYPENIFKMYSQFDTVITKLSGRAKKAGLKLHDKITSITPFDKYKVVSIMREGKASSITVPTDKDGMIGIMMEHKPSAREAVQYSPVEAIKHGLYTSYRITALTAQSVWKLFNGDIGIKNISGPVKIADYAGRSVDMGISAFLSFMAIISVNLGVINLLPIPLLDGGLLLFCFIEAVRGKPVSRTWRENLTYAGLAFVSVIGVIAVYNDITSM